LYKFIILFTLFLPNLSQAFIVTDLSGRQVEFNKLPQRIVLSEGRMMYLVMALQPKNPGENILALAEDMIKADPDTWKKLTALHPNILTKPLVTSPGKGQFEAENVFALDADLVIFSLNYKSSLQQSETLNRLDALSIPYLFIY